MTQRSGQPFGLWPSPIQPSHLAGATSFANVAWDHDGTLVWGENRPARSGAILIQAPDKHAPRDLNDTFSARGGVGYGGGAFTVGQGNVYFVEAKTQRIYKQPTHKGLARPITPAFGAAASPVLSPDGRHILYIHSYGGRDSIAVVDTDGGSWPQQVVAGDDFYMQPCWRPGADQIAWIAWNHPQMPWDGTTLHLAHIDSTRQTLQNITTIAGDTETAVFQPQFSPNGRYLTYIADQTGWWHLYLYDLSTGEHRQLTTGEAEYGVPAWLQDFRTYGFSDTGDEIFIIRNHAGFSHLEQINIASGASDQIQLEDAYTWLEQIAVHPGAPRLALIASGGCTPSRVITVDIDDGTRVWRRATSENLPASTYVPPDPIQWNSIDGSTTHGLFYRPGTELLADDPPPPVIVMVHSGPTTQNGAKFYPAVQFFTSRGYAVLQVNYRGSTGYGRAYRDALKGNWGIYDVQDVVSGVQYLTEQNLVDGGRAVIIGSSAGGFTALKALQDYPDVFAAGICSYAVADHFALAMDTHKFEAHYSDSLLGPLPAAADLYRQRSPINAVDRITKPVAIFQGGQDKVVLPEQAETLVAALQRNGVPHVYHLYPEEGHGFRLPETTAHFYGAIDKFLKQYVILA
ncbi:MAG: S9 family peptidase [Chloroflexota bacterium]